MSDMNKVDVLFVGAGPSSLAGAIRLKQMLKENNLEASVVIVEKSDKIGQHSLSGAVFEAGALDELMPGWKESQDPFVVKTLANRVEKDEVYFLSSGSAMRLPDSIMPSAMHHKGDYTLSLSEMVHWLSGLGRGLGVEIYNGFAVKDLVIEDGRVKGVRLGEKGLDKENQQMCNYLPGEIIEAKGTIRGEGSLGQLTEKLVAHFTLEDA